MSIPLNPFGKNIIEMTNEVAQEVLNHEANTWSWDENGDLCCTFKMLGLERMEVHYRRLLSSISVFPGGRLDFTTSIGATLGGLCFSKFEDGQTVGDIYFSNRQDIVDLAHFGVVFPRGEEYLKQAATPTQAEAVRFLNENSLEWFTHTGTYLALRCRLKDLPEDTAERDVILDRAVSAMHSILGRGEIVKQTRDNKQSPWDSVSTTMDLKKDLIEAGIRM